jgi:hypothetical protein
MDQLEIIRSALRAFEKRRPFTPGMFDPLMPLLQRLGCASAAVYLVDDYPDHMARVAGYGGEYPQEIPLAQKTSPAEEAASVLRKTRNLVIVPLSSHGLALGVLAASMTPPDAESLRAIAEVAGPMAYAERVRVNIDRERQERELFFAQALAGRLLVQDVPKIKHLRVGCEHVRSLEAGGDFFDFVAKPDGSLVGFVGSCSGSGLRTVLEVCGIIREIHRSLQKFDAPGKVLERINTLLVEEKHRRHQASLCVFRVSAVERRIRLAKSGRLGMLLCGGGVAGGGVEDISAHGTNFLGIVPKMDFRDEEYGFEPEQSLFCVTEGGYAGMDTILECVSAALGARRKKPLANAVFERVNRMEEYPIRTDASMLALSVEFLNNRESVRLFRGESGRFSR